MAPLTGPNIEQLAQKRQYAPWSGWAKLGGGKGLQARSLVAVPSAPVGGHLQVFATDEGDSVFSIGQHGLNSDWPDDWMALYGPADRAKALAAIAQTNGRFELIGIGTDDRVYHTGQAELNDPLLPGIVDWTREWPMLYGPDHHAKRIAVSAMEGGVGVFAIGADDCVYHTFMAPNGAWTNGWERLYQINERAKDLAVFGTTVFVIGMDDHVYFTWREWVPLNPGDLELPVGSEQWAGKWERLDQSAFTGKHLTVVQGYDQRLEVFALGTDNGIWHTWQIAPYGAWIGRWERLYGQVDQATGVSGHTTG